MSLLARSLIRRKGEVANWRVRKLGARDVNTGYPAVSWQSGVFFDPSCFDCDCFVCDSQIEIIKEHISTREVEVAGTRMTQQVVAFFTWAPIQKYDQVDYHGIAYEVESAEYPLYLGGTFSHQRAVMAQVM